MRKNCLLSLIYSFLNLLMSKHQHLWCMTINLSIFILYGFRSWYFTLGKSADFTFNDSKQRNRRLNKGENTFGKPSGSFHISPCKISVGLCQRTPLRLSEQKCPNTSSMFTGICRFPSCREINKKKCFTKTVPKEFYHQHILVIKHLFQKEMDIFLLGRSWWWLRH